MTSFQRWSGDLLALKRAAGTCPIAPIPAQAEAWFDINRKFLAGELTNEEGAAQLTSLKAQLEPWPLDWKREKMHGWYVAIAHYTFNGVPHWLVTIARTDDATTKDFDWRRRFITELGGDPKRDLLMYTGGGHDRHELSATWTWPKQRAQS